jgi:ribosome-binding factor A
LSQRTERIDELLRQEIGTILEREIADPRVGFVTVTQVETAPDLSHARVWVSIIGQPDERASAFAALGRAMPYVRRLLGERVRLRRIPDLHLRLDTSTERGTRVLQLLDELGSGGDIAPAPTGETLPTPLPRLPHEGDAAEPAAEGAPEPPGTTARPRRRRGGPSASGPGRDGRGTRGASRRGGRP